MTGGCSFLLKENKAEEDKAAKTIKTFYARAAEGQLRMLIAQILVAQKLKQIYFHLYIKPQVQTQIYINEGAKHSFTFLRPSSWA